MRIEDTKCDWNIIVFADGSGNMEEEIRESFVGEESDRITMVHNKRKNSDNEHGSKKDT